MMSPPILRRELYQVGAIFAQTAQRLAAEFPSGRDGGILSLY
jgi:hypothetical protein